ncbi:hypothetical protein [Brachybacterium saurashtrense]|uniref:hypothetical protein n=1 Tax=Brachybacterium saurashtrense TaxID=556288 RepID=UPI001F49F310|nr:hypothetical protein [Brachybacterium saurashtrense]
MRLTGLRGAAVVSATLLLAGCGAGAPGGPAGDGASDGTAATSPSSAADPALAAACTDFWGDPDYTAPLSRIVLDRAATAPEAGPSDPFFYSMTGDDVEETFAGAGEGAQQRSAALAEWFRTEPERGAEADVDAFRAAWEDVATLCREQSAAAQWALGPGPEHTKPSALVCADVFDTPGTLTHFGNANVLTSNMFKLVGLSPRAVPAGHEEELRATSELLAAEAAAADSVDVRDALAQVRAPFEDALAGDDWSGGLRDPLGRLGEACEAAGYAAPGVGEMDDSSAVVGANPDRQDPTVQEGLS